MTLLRVVAADGDHMDRTSSLGGEHVAHRSSSITAEFYHTDLVIDVHWNHSSVCAQFKYRALMCIQPLQAHLLDVVTLAVYGGC